MISNAKSRRTTVGAERFRYKVSSKPVSKGVYELNVTIQSEARNASKLLVTGIMQHDYHVNPPQCHEDHKYLPTILRIDIDGFIKEAIANGWDCAEKGQDFRLCASNELFRLYGFWEKRPKEWYQGRNYESKCGTWRVKDGLIKWPNPIDPETKEWISIDEAFLRIKAHRSKTQEEGEQDAPSNGG